MFDEFYLSLLTIFWKLRKLASTFDSDMSFCFQTGLEDIQILFLSRVGYKTKYRKISSTENAINITDKQTVVFILDITLITINTVLTDLLLKECELQRNFGFCKPKIVIDERKNSVSKIFL